MTSRSSGNREVLRAPLSDQCCAQILDYIREGYGSGGFPMMDGEQIDWHEWLRIAIAHSLPESWRSAPEMAELLTSISMKSPASLFGLAGNDEASTLTADEVRLTRALLSRIYGEQSDG